MAISGEDSKSMKGFFDGLMRAAADLQVSQAVKTQGEQIVSTVGRHVGEVLGEVQEVFDVVQNAFKNTFDFFKGFFTDVQGAATGMFSIAQADEQAFQLTSTKQLFDIDKNTSKANELFIDAANKQETLLEGMVEGIDKSNDIAEDVLQQTRKEEMGRIREPKKKKGAFGWLFDIFTGLLFAPLMLLAGLVAGFTDLWVKTIMFPMKLLKGLKGTRFAKIIMTPFKLLMKPFQLLMKNPITRAVFGFGRTLGKIFFPLFLIIDGLLGLTKFKKIFGKEAGIREAIEATLGGIASGFLKLPAMALDWTIKKLTGIETDFASFFTIENLATHFHDFVDWINTAFVQPIKDFFQSDTWDFIKDETKKTLDTLGLLWEKLSKVIRETFEFWSEKFQGLIDLMFKETDVEKRYREKELAGTAAVDVGLGMGDIGLSYGKKEAEDIMALGSTAEERRAALAQETVLRRKEAQTQHDALMGKMDKLIEVTELFTPSVSIAAPTAVSKLGGPIGQPEPREQVAGVQHNSALP